MATSLTINSVAALIDWNYIDNSSVAYQSVNANSFRYSSGQMANGTGSTTTADRIYFATVTIAASGTSSVDLSGGSTDVYGNTITMARVKWMFVWNTNTTSASSINFGNATNPLANWISTATVTVSILNNGVFMIGAPGATGYAVTGGSADAVKATNADGSNSATVTWCFVGSTA